MRKRWNYTRASLSSTSWFALLLLLVLPSFSTPVRPAELAATTVVSVYPSSVVASEGQDFDIDVITESVSDLYGWEFRLAWNAALLDVASVAEGPFLKGGGNTFFSYNVNASAGRVVLDCTLLGSVLGVSGSGTLATVTFHVKNSGQCLLDLYDVTLLNHLEETIPCQVNDGYGTFTGPHDVAVTDVQASQLTALPGTVVKVNVTVKNQGGYTEGFNVTAYANTAQIGRQYVSLASGLSTVVAFNWNTVGFGKGEYAISGEAGIVPGEADTSDNNKTANDKVTILYLGHDIAVVGARTVKTIVGQGYNETVEVTVKNYGSFAETFNTTANVNGMTIGTQTTTLASGNIVKLNFTWNTTGFAYGNYTISAAADAVENETDTTDNNLTDGWITVTIPGDVNGDFRCEGKDIAIIAKAYGSLVGQAGYVSNADINDDGKIDGKDIAVASKYYGTHYP